MAKGRVIQVMGPVVDVSSKTDTYLRFTTP